MTLAVIFLLPLALTAAVATLARLLAGAERAPKWCGLSLSVGFLVSWAVVVHPGWVPVDDVSRVGHIALGAALIGLALDLLPPARLWAALVVIPFFVVCAFASVTRITTTSGPNQPILSGSKAKFNWMFPISPASAGRSGVPNR